MSGFRGDASPAVALVVLGAVALVSPWAFGAVDPLPRVVLTVSCLAAAGAASAAAVRSGLLVPDLPLWPLGGLLGLGLFQLVPLPAPLLRLIAPGPARVWYPENEAAARLLGAGPRPISLDPAATAAAIAFAVGLVSVALLAAPALARPKAAKRAGAAVAGMGAALAVYAILARTRLGAFLYGHFAVPTVSPFGPFVSKNHFAGYIVPASLLTLGLCLGLAARSREHGSGDRRAPGVVAGLVCALAMALSLFVSQSRGGVVAAAGGVLVLGVLVWSDRVEARRWVPTAVLAVFVLGLLAAALPDEARTRVTNLEGASFRLQTWRDGLRLFARSPFFGHGLGAFADAYAPLKQGHGTIRVEHAENEYVEVLAEGGLVGLSLVVAAAALIVARFLAARRGVEPLRRGLAEGALAGLAAVAVHGAFDFVLQIPAIAGLAALLAAFLGLGAGPPRQVQSRPAVVAGLALLLLGLGVATAVAGRRLFDRDQPFAEVRREAEAAASATSLEVRRLRVERASWRLRDVLSDRPAFAEGWLLMAALVNERGDGQEARALAAHAAALDPTRADLQAAAQRLTTP